MVLFQQISRPVLLRIGLNSGFICLSLASCQLLSARQRQGYRLALTSMRRRSQAVSRPPGSGISCANSMSNNPSLNLTRQRKYGNFVQCGLRLDHKIPGNAANQQSGNEFRPSGTRQHLERKKSLARCKVLRRRCRAKAAACKTISGVQKLLKPARIISSSACRTEVWPRP